MAFLHWVVLHGGEIGATTFLVLLVSGPTLSIWRFDRALRADARRRCSSLGEGHSHIAGLPEGTKVSLVGTIQLTGSPTLAFEDDISVAAASSGDERALPIVSRRAETLTLVVEDATVAIDGPVTVISGCRETTTRGQFTRLEPGGAPSSSVRCSSVFAEDRVIVSGVLGRQDLGYRATDSSWSLTAAPLGPDGTGSVEIAAVAVHRIDASPLRPILTGLAWGVAVFAALFVVAYLSYCSCLEVDGELGFVQPPLPSIAEYTRT